MTRTTARPRLQTRILEGPSHLLSASHSLDRRALSHPKLTRVAAPSPLPSQQTQTQPRFQSASRQQPWWASCSASLSDVRDAATGTLRFEKLRYQDLSMQHVKPWPTSHVCCSGRNQYASEKGLRCGWRRCSGRRDVVQAWPKVGATPHGIPSLPGNPPFNMSPCHQLKATLAWIHHPPVRARVQEMSCSGTWFHCAHTFDSTMALARAGVLDSSD
jgi:hypothetical protein